MDMKWHPVKNLEQWLKEDVDPEGTYLFTFQDDEFDETSVDVDIGTFVPGVPTKVMYLSGLGESYSLLEHIVAWMEIPEPFKPGRCDMCKHWKEWIDEYGDGCAECELHKNVPFTKINPGKCPLEK